MNIIRDLKNDLLKRREVKVIVNSIGNPGIKSASDTISKQFKSGEDVIAIKAVRGKFGRDTFLIEAFIYDSVAGKAKIEPKLKVKKAAGAA